MTQSNTNQPAGSLADVLGSLRRKGVKLWQQNGELRYRAPKGALKKRDIEYLGAFGGQVIAALAAADTGTDEFDFGPRPRLSTAPLTHSQRAHWVQYGLNARCGLRQIVRVVRLRGRLDVDALRRSAQVVVGRHEALRTHVVSGDSGPIQKISPAVDHELVTEDLTRLPKDVREARIQQRIERFILEPIDLATGPLLGMKLLSCGHDEHVFIVALEHIISDAFSLNVLLHEIFTAYAQVMRGRPVSLPPIQVQFPDYALWQTESQNSWIETHGAYWSERLAGSKRLRGPVDERLPDAAHGWGTARIHIGAALKAELQDRCRSLRTTFVMGVFSAYVASVLSWCRASEAIFQYQTDGRGDPGLENTIGYLASALYLRVRLSGNDSFADLLTRVTDEYCNAYQHADAAYFGSQVPRPEFSRNPLFNWLPTPSGNYFPELLGSAHALSCSPVHFTHPMLDSLDTDQEPMVLLHDTDAGIFGDLLFPRKLYTQASAERFVESFVTLISEAMKRPGDPLGSITPLR